MFYTLISKTPYITKSNNSLLPVFILGSIMYLVLHYYLFSQNMPDIISKNKMYIYYLIIVDLILAVYLINTNQTHEDAIKQEHVNKVYTDDDKQAIERNIQELKRVQLLNLMKQNEIKNERDSEKKSKKKKKTKHDTDTSSSSSSSSNSSKSKTSKVSKKSKSSHKSKDKQDIRDSDKTPVDTEIPNFNS